MRLLDTLLAVTFLSPAFSWVPSIITQHRVRPVTTTRLASSSSDAADVTDCTGKTIYQRAFCQLSSGSSVSNLEAVLNPTTE
jgi:hypothetical protein